MLSIVKGWLAALVLLASCGSPVPAAAMTIKGDVWACTEYAHTIRRVIEYRNRNNEMGVWSWEQASPYLFKSLEKARMAEGTWIRDDEDVAFVKRNMYLAWQSFGEPGSVAAIYFKGCIAKEN